MRRVSGSERSIAACAACFSIFLICVVLFLNEWLCVNALSYRLVVSVIMFVLFLFFGFAYRFLGRGYA